MIPTGMCTQHCQDHFAYMRLGDSYLIHTSSRGGVAQQKYQLHAQNICTLAVQRLVFLLMSRTLAPFPIHFLHCLFT